MTFQPILSIKTASYADTVRLSVMPKGVEHEFAAGPFETRWPVRLSVMPKGVEHLANSTNTSAAFACDFQ